LFRRPFLVVLDEPNSNLDNEGEQALGETIRSLRESGSIVVVIAHRPSAIAQVNKVLVLQRGAQMAFGPKEEVVPRLVQPLRQQEGQQHAG